MDFIGILNNLQWSQIYFFEEKARALGVKGIWGLVGYGGYGVFEIMATDWLSNKVRRRDVFASYKCSFERTIVNLSSICWPQLARKTRQGETCETRPVRCFYIHFPYSEYFCFAPIVSPCLTLDTFQLSS